MLASLPDTRFTVQWLINNALAFVLKKEKSELGKVQNCIVPKG